MPWWGQLGRHTYPHAPALTILADSGGSHGCCPRARKHALQHCLCDRYGLTVTVAHNPSGRGKWNPIPADDLPAWIYTIRLTAPAVL